MNDKPIKVLLIEDNPGDTRLIQEMLAEVKNASFEIESAERLSKGLEYLSTEDIDVLLLDLSLPDSQGLDTFIQAHSQKASVPIIVLTSLNDEVLAARAVREGAQDYLLKNQVDSNLLARAIRYAIERKRTENEREELISKLEDALAKVKVLSGFLPICSNCKKIRDDEGYWHSVETYMREHSEAEFTHSICPDCAKKLYPWLDEDKG